MSQVIGKKECDTSQTAEREDNLYTISKQASVHEEGEY